MGRHKCRWRTNIKLKTKLNDLPKDCIVKIGSKNCFLYAYYNNDLIEERLKNIDTKNMDHIDKLILKNTNKGKYELVKAYVIKKGKYKPLLERNIKRCYKSEVEDNTYIIIINGNETGNYWCIDEYAYKNKLYIASKDRHYQKERLEVKKLNYGY